MSALIWSYLQSAYLYDGIMCCYDARADSSTLCSSQLLVPMKLLHAGLTYLDVINVSLAQSCHLKVQVEHSKIHMCCKTQSSFAVLEVLLMGVMWSVYFSSRVVFTVTNCSKTKSFLNM